MSKANCLQLRPSRAAQMRLCLYPQMAGFSASLTTIPISFSTTFRKAGSCRWQLAISILSQRYRCLKKTSELAEKGCAPALKLLSVQQLGRETQRYQHDVRFVAALLSPLSGRRPSLERWTESYVPSGEPLRSIKLTTAARDCWPSKERT